MVKNLSKGLSVRWILFFVCGEAALDMSRGKSMYCVINFIFQVLVYIYQSLEYVYQTLEYMYQGLVYKISREGKDVLRGEKTNSSGREIVGEVGLAGD